MLLLGVEEKIKLCVKKEEVMRILLVDDEKFIREIIRRSLAPIDARSEFQGVNNGQESLNIPNG
jgi:CheY-like chemotaxis protein